MNRTIIMLLVSLAWVVGVAQADESIKFEQAIWLPATARLQTAPGFKTLDCGFSPIGHNGEKVLFHLYTFPNRPQENCSYFDLFIRNESKQKFSRINSVKVNEFVSGSFSTITWLDRKHRRLPIVSLDDGVGYQFLLTFSKGIFKKPIVQDFEEYRGEQVHMFVWLDRTDERGLTVVRNHRTQIGNGPEPDSLDVSERLFYWNGHKFAEKRPQ